VAGPRRFNIVSLFIFLFFGFLFYASYQLIPVLWKKAQLEDMIKEESYGAKRRGAESVKKAIVTSAQARFHVDIPEESVEVERLEDRARVWVTWNVTFMFFTKPIPFTFPIYKETVFY
jgi:hypothetical protein